MGRSKAELKIDGSTFLERTVAVCGKVFDETVAVQRFKQPDVRGLRTIFEAEHPHHAPIFGVIRALEDAGARAWVLAVDYPLLTSDVLSYFAESFDRAESECWIPEWDGKQQMLCAGYSESLLRRFRDAVSAGAFSLRGAIKGATIVCASEEDLRARIAGEPLFNVNDEADYERAMAIGGNR